MSAPSSRSHLWGHVAPLLGSLCISALASCGSDPPESDSREALVIRARAAAHFMENRFVEAREALAPLVAEDDVAVEDLVRAAAIELAATEFEDARELLRRAAELDPERADVQYNQGRIAQVDLDFDLAIEHYARAWELTPDDYPTRLAYANALYEQDRFEEAEPHYRAMLEVGLDYGGSWYLTTVYRLSRLLNLTAPSDDHPRFLEYQELNAEYDELYAQGITVPNNEDLDRGNYGRLLPPQSPGLDVVTSEGFEATQLQPGAYLDAAGAQHLRALALIEAWAPVDRNNEVETYVGGTDLVAWGTGGLWLLRQSSAGDWSVEHALTDSIEVLEPLDFDQDGDIDLALVRGGELAVLEQDEGAWIDAPAIEGAESARGARAVLAVDYDHEGDLDLVAVGDFGARLFRCDIAEVGDVQQGTWIDASAESGLPSSGSYDWVLAEDFDTDQDVDLLFGGAAGLFLADNLRGGQFGDQSERMSAAEPEDLRARPIAADLDADGRPDLWCTGGAQAVLWSRLSTQFAREALQGGLDAEALARADINADGLLDLVGAGAGGPQAALLGLGLPARMASTWSANDHDWLDLVAADLDADGDVDIASLDAAGVQLHLAQDDAPRSTRLALRGIKDNQRGVGAIVELLAGPIYRRIYWRGEPIALGLGGQEMIDVLRVTWTNGVVQHEVDIPAGAELCIKQKEGLIGSCPFLYTWNGEEFEYITDVLGITPLGLPMGPGMLVPPDHDEYILIRAEQLAPKDGVYELQITEELREVTYLDLMRLEVIDHAADAIYPDERFTFPPFPEYEVHAVVDPAPPLRATASDGGDWTAELAAIDSDYAAPFEQLQGQFQGLATPHWIELEFDPERVAKAERLRLLCTGWLFWTDASVNMAAAHAPGVDFIPPIVQLPDGQGGWRDAGPPVGFPAGKTKTMILELDGLLDPADPRIRLFSTLRLYWDALTLATDAGTAEQRITRLDPIGAELWERGYTEPYVLHEEHGLEWFRWETHEAFPRWNQHPGMYTRYGDVLELLEEVDDMYVIMGAGDAMTLRFDASELPPLPAGHRRDFLLYADGWAKDRDPNTVEALYVEPLPFHGMSGYPYGADEHFPDDAEHQAWRREWNTRPAKQWIRAMAPNAFEPVRR